MIYLTGDTHGRFGRLLDFSDKMRLTKTDTVIILGDVGFNVFGDARDCYNKYHINSLGFTVFCVNGNHKMRPYDIKTYKMKEYNGGLVWYEDEFPNLLFAKDGEVYDLGGMKCMVIGGAYSIDKPIRIAMGYPWFENEQPSSEIKCFVERDCHSGIIK